MNFYFVNHNGKKIDFADFPYCFQSGDLLDYSYTYTTVEGRRNNLTKDYRKTPREYNVQIAVMPDYSLSPGERLAKWKEDVNYLAEVIDEDVVENVSGKLYSENGSYLNCKFIGSKKSNWTMGLPFMFNDFTVLADNPDWIKEKTRKFIAGDIVPGQDLDYPHNYDYNYTSASRGNINWDTDHYAASEFLMRIYGPCVDPKVNINGHAYTVFDTLDASDYIEINSLERTIVKHRSNGTTLNLLNMRGMQQSVFEPVPGGVINVNWSGDFGFDLTLYEKRSEPAW